MKKIIITSAIIVTGLVASLFFYSPIFSSSSPFGEGGLRGIYNWILKGGEGFNNNSAEAAAPKNGLIGYWTMDTNDVSGTIYYDKSGFGNHATSTGSPTIATGKINQAIGFDGTNKFLDTADNDAFDGLSAITASAWIKFNTAGSQRGLIVEKGSINTVWELYEEVDGLKWRGGGAANTYTFTFTPEAGRWYHVVVAQSGTSATMYLDGKSKGAQTVVAIGSSAAGVRIGSFGTSYSLNGSIDDVRIYNRALSAAEVSQLYNSAKTTYTNSAPRTASSTPSGGRQLVGWWTMDTNDVNGTTVYDKSGKGNHGTGTNITSADAVSGKIGQAINFDGSTESISATITQPSAWTESVWVKPIAYPVLAGFVTSINNYAMDLQVVSTGVARLQVSNGNFVDSTSTLPIGKWSHITAGYDGSRAFLYIDGKLEVATNKTATTGSSFLIGKRSDGYFFNGSIDDIRIYNRALSAQEVTNLYNSAKTSYANATVRRTGLVLDLNFGNNDGTAAPTVYDISGYNRHATSTSGSTSPTCGQKFCNFDGTDYMTVDASGVFGSAQTSVAIKFSPDFDASDGASHMFYDSVPVATTRYLISKHSDNTLIVYLGGSNWAIPLSSYQNFWKREKENVLILVASDGSPDTSKVWLNGNLIYNGTSAWSNDPETSICIGKQCNSTPIFDGKIHYFKIWNRLLSDNEVAIFSADRETNE